MSSYKGHSVFAFLLALMFFHSPLLIALTLIGANIPETARIIGVADAYDAMTSKRSYRDPLPQEKVKSEIQNGLGKQFDPVYGQIMLDLIDEDKDYKMKEN